MKIGIVSDSHGRTNRLKAAVEAMRRHGVEAVVHCGDLIGPEAIDALAKAGTPVYAVAGNMDHNIAPLAQAAERQGVTFSGEVVEVPLGQDRFLVATHGNDQEILGELIAGRQFPYVCHGHTHCRRDERVDHVRVINPGALNHPKHPNYPSAAVLDTETDSLEWLQIAR
jgi:hypothetical protein